MYAQSAQVYDLLVRSRDYAAAAAQLRSMFYRLFPAATTLLDVGCGTGRHLEGLRPHYRVEGLDLSKEMLEIARERLGQTPLHIGNLTDFDLGKKFDIVTCLFGSIGYTHDFTDLLRALKCMTAHLVPGGLLVVEPWLTPDRFNEGRVVYDSCPEGPVKVARMYVARRRGQLSIFDIDYLVGTAEGVSHFREHQELALYTEHEYRSALLTLGLTSLDEPAGCFAYGLYVARKP
jgi:SAM-dependent methyltransferase